MSAAAGQLQGDSGWLQLLWHMAVQSAAVLPAADVARLDGRLRAEGGGELGPAIAAYLGELRAVEQRGIASEEERGLVQDRFAQIRGTPGFEAEVGRLEAVLSAWFRRAPGHGGPAAGAPAV